MLFENISLLDENFEVCEGMFAGTQGAEISYIGDKMPREDFGEVYDGAGKILMSGLFNAHSHAAMTLLRGYAEGLPLSRWLNEKIFPFEAKLSGEDVYCGTMLAAAEMLRFGVVSFSDMYMFGSDMARAVIDSGMKANICVSTVCFDGSSYFDLPACAESGELYKKYHNSFDGKIKVDYCIHAEYTSTRRVVRELAGHVKSLGANIQLHLSETQAEHVECKKRQGMTPAEYFADCGVFDSPATAAHCVWIEDSDIDILKKYNVSVASNPASNMKLASGFAPIPKLLEKGVNVCLGTDGCASNNNLNMWKDIYLFSILYKGAFLNPAAVTAREALRCATAGGAAAQGRKNCGALKEGNRADLIVVDMDVPNMYPATDVVSNLCYSSQGGDVCLTMADGKVLYKDGEYKTLDIEKIKHDACACAKRILAEIY